MTLLELLDRPIAFQRCFVALTGSINAALMLSQAVYWSRRGESGWFWKSRDEWQDETGLTHEQQETARKRLATGKYWQERDERLAHKVWFRVDEDALRDALKTTVSPNRETRFGGAAKAGITAPRKTVPSIQAEITSEITSHTKAAGAAGETSNGSKMDGFELFWKEWPKKKSKGDAEKAWARMGCCKIVEEIIMALTDAKASHQWTKPTVPKGRFIPYPASWLNDKGWLDEIAPAPKTESKKTEPRVF